MNTFEQWFSLAVPLTPRLTTPQCPLITAIITSKRERKMLAIG